MSFSSVSAIGSALRLRTVKMGSVFRCFKAGFLADEW